MRHKFPGDQSQWLLWLDRILSFQQTGAKRYRQITICQAHPEERGQRMMSIGMKCDTTQWSVVYCKHCPTPGRHRSFASTTTRVTSKLLTDHYTTTFPVSTELERYLSLPAVKYLGQPQRNIRGSGVVEIPSTYPQLSKEVQRSLCLPASSASLERAFSVANG